MRFFHIAFAAGAIVLAATQSAQAAVVTWSAPVNISDGASADLDVSTTGTLFSAINIGDAALATIVNGVTFVSGTGTSFDGGNVSLTGGAFTYPGLRSSTGNTDYDALLNISHGGLGLGVLTFNTLTDSQDYQIQLWVNDSRNAVLGRTATVQDPDGGSLVTLLQNQNTTGDPNTGQYVLGTFTAIGTSQVINLNGPTGFNASAVQLRAVTAVPEPSSCALVALVMGIAGVRSRKRRQTAS